MTVLEDGCVGSAPVNFQGRPVDFRLRDRRPATKKGYAGSTMLCLQVQRDVPVQALVFRGRWSHQSSRGCKQGIGRAGEAGHKREDHSDGEKDVAVFSVGIRIGKWLSCGIQVSQLALGFHVF